ncbi:hypothetical protein GCM10027592_45810 [Spirosoma flavus]
MFFIKKTQLAIFSKIDYKEFRERLALWILKNYPEKVWRLGPEELNNKLDQVVLISKSFQIQTERNVAWMADFTFQLEEHFHKNEQYKWIVEILDNYRLDEDDKIDQIKAIIYPNIDEY